MKKCDKRIIFLSFSVDFVVLIRLATALEMVHRADKDKIFFEKEPLFFIIKQKESLNEMM